MDKETREFIATRFGYIREGDSLSFNLLGKQVSYSFSEITSLPDLLQKTKEKYKGLLEHYIECLEFELQYSKELLNTGDYMIQIDNLLKP